MKKDILSSFIEKQQLGGLVKSVRWKINNNKIKVNFATETKDCIGEIICNCELDNNELGIFDISQLYKLIKILKDPISIDLEKNQDKCLRMNIKDENFYLTYNLADLGLITEGKLSNQLPEPILSLELSNNFIEKFIKAHNANDKADKLQIKSESKTKTIKFIIGLTDKFSNKISFVEKVEDFCEIPTFTYDVSNFREILVNNKDTNIKLHIYSMGIVRIDTSDENIQVSYYLVPNR